MPRLLLVMPQMLLTVSRMLLTVWQGGGGHYTADLLPITDY